MEMSFCFPKSYSISFWRQRVVIRYVKQTKLAMPFGGTCWIGTLSLPGPHRFQKAEHVSMHVIISRYRNLGEHSKLLFAFISEEYVKRQEYKQCHMLDPNKAAELPSFCWFTSHIHPVLQGKQTNPTCYKKKKSTDDTLAYCLCVRVGR